MEENGKVPVLKASLIYGAIVGLVIGVISVILYFIGQSLEDWARYLTLALILVLNIGSLVMFKKEYGKGYATFGQLLAVAMIVGITSSIITSTFSFLLFQIDESYLQDIKYEAVEEIDKRMEKQDLKFQERYSADQYDAVADRLESQHEKMVDKTMARSAFATSYLGVINSIFFSFFIGLIAGLILKKKPPLMG